MSTFVRARSDRMRVPRIAFSDLNAVRTLDRLPAVKLCHLHRMTDHTGLLQHAVFRSRIIAKATRPMTTHER